MRLRHAKEFPRLFLSDVFGEFLPSAELRNVHRELATKMHAPPVQAARDGRFQRLFTILHNLCPASGRIHYWHRYLVPWDRYHSISRHLFQKGVLKAIPKDKPCPKYPKCPTYVLLNPENSANWETFRTWIPALSHMFVVKSNCNHSIFKLCMDVPMCLM